jgi:transmembrane sensor
MTSKDGNMNALDREALDWLVRLGDRPDDDALHAGLEAWLERSPAHKASWARVLDLDAAVEAALAPAMAGSEMQRAAAVAPVTYAAQNVVPLRAGTRLRGAFSRHWRMAGGLAIATCLGLMVLPDIALHLRAQETTATGEVRTVVLDDGTRVHLAPGSAMSFDVDGGQRSAHLLRGRAFFDVAHDAARPFRVIAQDTVVTVLGTAFEVDGLSTGASVAVRRGTVAVDYAGHGPKAVLHRGDTVALAPDGHAERGVVRADRIAGWIDGRMFVKDRPVGEVLEGLRPWYRGYIAVRGPGLTARRVTGIYDLRDPEAALAAIAKVHPLRVRQVTPWMKIVTVE